MSGPPATAARRDQLADGGFTGVRSELPVVLMAGVKRAQQSLEPSAPKLLPYEYTIRQELNLPYPDPVEIKQARESPADV